MEEIRCVPEETQEEHNAKLKRINAPLEEEDDGVPEETQEEPDPKLMIIEGALEEEEEDDDDDDDEDVRGDTVDEEDSDEDFKGWDENGDPYLPFGVSWHPPRVLVCSAGKDFTEEQAEKMVDSVYERNYNLLSEWCAMANSKMTPLPAMPLDVLPDITAYCVSGDQCYHLRYWTEIISETVPDHPYFIPCEMMQVFSLELSSPRTHPVNIYGWFSVRDSWEPLRNYLFNRRREDSAMIPKDCSFLPLGSPCRGIYVSQYFLIDIGLWIKKEEENADELLFRGYVEMNTSLAGFGSMLRGRFQGDSHGLEMDFAFLGDSIETVIEVKAEAKQPSDVRISALTSGFQEEISLYDGKFCGSGSMFKHFMAVDKQGELHVVLKMDGYLPYKWTFKAGVGVVVAPEHPVSGFTQYFVMNVSFRTRGKAASAWQWSCICNNVCVSETNL